MKSRCRTAGFTLVELLVVISIIALLISILLPSLKRARDQAKDTLCRSNLHQLGVAIQYYISDNHDRLMWIKGSKNDDFNPPKYNKAPFRQYHQIFHLHPYLKDLSIYVCPQAKVVKRHARFGSPQPKPQGRPGSVTGYEQGDGPNKISYYAVLKADPLFMEAYKRRDFPHIDPFAIAGETIEELHTEYWFNDWNEGAGSASGEIPAISGNLISHIPYPEHAVMMSDAVDWNPRHNGGNHFMFLDTHVSRVEAEQYFDPEGPDNNDPDFVPKDQDSFGNHPYWAWGLGKNIRGY